MIGRIKGDGWAATLEDDGRWTCTDDLIALFLEFEFDRTRYSEADGVFGLRLLHDAAARLGGAVEGVKTADDGGPEGEREILLSVYVCQEDHLHASTRTQGVLIDDRVICPADDWPDLKSACRDEHGRFAPCGGGGSGGTGRTARERREQGERSLAKARQLIKDIRGGPHPVPDSKVKELHDHLGTMTVAQMHQIKKEHDLKASGKTKRDLQAKLAIFFARVPKGGSPRPDAQVPRGTFGLPKGVKWENAVEADRYARAVLGASGTKEQLAACCGVPNGAKVLVEKKVSYADSSERYQVEFNGTMKVKDPATGEVKDERYGGYRTIHVNKDGSRYIHNDLFEGKGAGLGMLGRQVENASQHGFDRIETHAAGWGGGVTGQRNLNSGLNGYYTWPRFGYNGMIPSRIQANIPPGLRADVARHDGKVSGLMETKAGRDWWLGHGSDLIDCKFDLRPGSYSQRTLLSNLKERGIVK